MKNEIPPSSSAYDFEDVGPELKSYIYQTISEFEPFSTPETVVAVIAKDPLKRAKHLQRVSITLTDDGAKLEEEGLGETIYIAIRDAKEKLLKRLCEIQDEMISNQERTSQINAAFETGLHLH